MERIVGIGIDEVERARVLRACKKEHFLRRCFSERERALIAQKNGRAATNFAGKEAVAKCLGTGFGKIAPSEIEILREENGKPYVALRGKAKQQAQKAGVTFIFISLTDTKSVAAAYAVATGGCKKCLIQKEIRKFAAKVLAIFRQKR